MSMTREEAIVNLEKLIALFHTESEQSKMVDYSKIIETLEFAAAALRPVSREQVEKVKGEWIWDTNGLYPKPVCSKCGEEPYRRSNHTSDLPNYCPKCGCPMTDEAVQMVMERLNKLEETKK